MSGKDRASLRRKETAYWIACVSAHEGNPRKLWRSIDSLLQRKNDDTAMITAVPMADQLVDYFAEKVLNIRNATVTATEPLSTLPEAKSTCDHLVDCDTETIRKMIMTSSSASCDSDPIPTVILKKLLTELLPYIVKMCNTSLHEGLLPRSQKRAIVKPIIKKNNLDPSDVKNYRPISNLTFISKLIERIIAKRLTSYLTDNDLMPFFQSAYRKYHSTETSITNLLSNIYNIIDKGCIALLGLLDLSAAFDCVDHDILINRLSFAFGIKDKPLNWLSSFLRERSHIVNFNGMSSESYNLVCGVPQGSVLGPLLFTLYTSDVEDIALRWGLMIQSYADDIEILGHSRTEDVTTLADTFTCCIGEIEEWMFTNRLKLNPDKTQFIWFGTRQRLSKVTLHSISLENVAIQNKLLSLVFIKYDNYGRYVVISLQLLPSHLYMALLQAEWIIVTVRFSVRLLATCDICNLS
jgi:hypothetical protein